MNVLLFATIIRAFGVIVISTGTRLVRVIAYAGVKEPWDSGIACCSHTLQRAGVVMYYTLTVATGRTAKEYCGYFKTPDFVVDLTITTRISLRPSSPREMVMTASEKYGDFTTPDSTASEHVSEYVDIMTPKIVVNLTSTASISRFETVATAGEYYGVYDNTFHDASCAGASERD